jgi:hypothetical protein
MANVDVVAKQPASRRAVVKKKVRKKRKKGVSSSQKGFGFERKLAVIFGKWWTAGERDDVFWRTDGSGSRATSRARRGKRTRFQYGDMTFTDPIGQPLIEAFSFEFKNYKTYDLLSALSPTDPNKSWLVFWAEAGIDAKLSEREPILITKKNQHKVLMWMPKPLFVTLYSLGFRPYPRMFIELKAQTVRLKLNKTVDIPQHCVVGILFDDFIAQVDPQIFKEMLYATGRAQRIGSTSNTGDATTAAAEAARDYGEETGSDAGSSSSTS